MSPSELKAWRNSVRLTLDDAADAFGVARSTYAAWEAGGDSRPSRPKFAQIPKLAELACAELDRRIKKRTAA